MQEEHLEICLSHDDCPVCPYAQRNPFSKYVWYCGCGYPFLEVEADES